MPVHTVQWAGSIVKWVSPSKSRSIKQRPTLRTIGHCSFAHSALAWFRMGINRAGNSSGGGGSGSAGRSAGDPRFVPPLEIVRLLIFRGNPFRATRWRGPYRPNEGSPPRKRPGPRIPSVRLFNTSRSLWVASRHPPSANPRWIASASSV